MTILDDRLLPVFAAQHWVVSLDDVRRAGGTRSGADHRVRIGRWEPVDVSVFRLIGTPATWEARLLAPILAIGPPAVASHLAAAVLHGLPGFGRGVPELTIARGQEHRRPGARVHTSTDLDRCQPTVVANVPCTGLPRTILDVARYVSDERLARAIEAGRRAGQLDWSVLIRALSVHARRGRPGIRRLRRVILANMDRADVTDSDLELLVLGLIAEANLPAPVLHHRVYSHGRFVAEVDLAYPALKIAIELDGGIHRDKDVWERDQPRQNDLILEGWIVLRFSYDRYRARPDRIVAEIRAAIASRSTV
jgi:hypothetical protein